MSLRLSVQVQPTVLFWCMSCHMMTLIAVMKLNFFLFTFLSHHFSECILSVIYEILNPPPKKKNWDEKQHFVYSYCCRYINKKHFFKKELVPSRGFKATTIHPPPQGPSFSWTGHLWGEESESGKLSCMLQHIIFMTFLTGRWKEAPGHLMCFRGEDDGWLWLLVESIVVSLFRSAANTTEKNQSNKGSHFS